MIHSQLRDLLLLRVRKVKQHSMPQFKIGIPVEELVIKLLEFAMKYRETMRDDIRDRWDLMLLEDVERLRNGMMNAGEWLEQRADRVHEKIKEAKEK